MHVTSVALGQFAHKTGGYAGLEMLPEDTRSKMLAYHGEIMVINASQFVIRLADVKDGYCIYDHTLQFRYAVPFDHSQQDFYDQYGYDSVMNVFWFGYSNLDLLFVNTLRPGDFFYLAYTRLDRTRNKLVDEVMFVLMNPNPGQIADNGNWMLQ